MKEPELTLYRAAIGQILADAGITRSTIHDMVREMIRQKVEKQFEYVAREEINSYKFKNKVQNELEEAIRKVIRSEMSKVKINVTVVGGEQQ